MTKNLGFGFALLCLVIACTPGDDATGGIPCGPNGECPTGFTCQADNQCVPSVPLRIIDAAIAARSDATAIVFAPDAAGLLDAPMVSTTDAPASAVETRIDSAPPAFTRLADAVITFAGTPADPGLSFSCTLDGENLGACSSPFQRTLADGPHSFAVTAAIGARVDPTPATAAFTVDTVPPDTTIASGPADPSLTSEATFVFTSSEPEGTFLCSRDGGVTNLPCASGDVFSSFALGPEDFLVAAVDRAGNVDPTPATWHWTVTALTPDTLFTMVPAALTRSASATFVFVSSPTGATFTCVLDGAPITCVSPLSLTGVADGPHTLAVTATLNAVADPTPAEASWTVDTQPPSLGISAPRPGDVTGPAGTITFTGGDAATLACTIDGAVTVPACDASGTVAFGGLAAGDHTFAVTATDAAGNPASRSVGWTVDAIGPPVAIAPPSDPNGTVGQSCSSGQVDFGVDAASDPQAANPSWPDTDAIFDCELDGPGGTVTMTPSCTPPFAYSLAPGAYTLKVIARDRFQNRGAVGSAAFTVVTPRTAVSLESPAAGATTGPSGIIRATLDAGAILTSCTLQPGAIDCLSSMMWSGLLDAQNPHSVTLAARDECGVSSQASAGFNVDSTGPTVLFTRLPSDQTSPVGTLPFARTDDATTFTCAVDGQPATCGAGGLAFSLHSLGGHTVTVQGADALGNPGPTDSYTFNAGIFIDTCGASGTDDCAARLPIPGGPFVRDNAVNTPAAHQTMRDFNLDKYEVTNARWNVFAQVGMPVPPAGGGHHFTDLSSGWDPSWNGKPLADSQGRAGVGPGAQPVAWVTWYGAFAFCAFSGGYLPYEGEWDYAAAGGSENRIYPWGNTPVPDRTLADFNCNSEIPASLNCGIATSLLAVGSEPAGAGKWGQLDLAGSIDELVLDRSDPSMVVFAWDNSGVMLPADDAHDRVVKGGNFAFHYSFSDRDGLKTFTLTRTWGVRAVGDTVGFRCAYPP